MSGSRHGASSRIEDAAALLAAIVASSSDAILSHTLDGAITSWNRATERLFGYTADEMVGRSIRLLIPAERQAEEDRVVNGINAGEHVDDYETVRRRKDGTLVDVSVTVSPVRDRSGAIIGASKIIRDITEKKRAEQREAWLAAIVTSSFDGIASKSLQGIVTSWNESAERIFGYSAEDMIGQSIRRVIPANRQGEEDVILARIAAGERVENYETVRQRKDGTLIDVSVTISPVRDRSGTIIGASKIVRDITDRKRQEEKIRLLMREVNHRSKNMLSLVQAIARQTAATEPKDFLRRFDERVRAVAASQDLLVKNDWQGADLEQLIRSQLAHFEDFIDTRIMLAGPPLTITAAAAQALGMAIHELATNAGKYGALSSGAGNVHVQWDVQNERGEDTFVISWRESGGPPVRAPEKRGFGSTVTCPLAERSLDASIELQYKRAGLRWQLRCPADSMAERSKLAGRGDSGPPLSATQPAPRAISSPKARVLVVEDEVLVAFQIECALRDAGFDVVGPAKSTAEALILLQSPCNGAVLDIMLGSETSEPIAKALIERGIPFITLSGYSQEQRPKIFADVIALSKPLASERLVEQLRRCIMASGKASPSALG